MGAGSTPANTTALDLDRLAVRRTYSDGRALTTPAIDLLCGGGFSILLMGVFLALTRTPLTPSQFSVENVVIVSALINWPHFMASYRLLYSSSEMVRRYKWAAVYFPILLFGYAAYALADSIHIEGKSIHYTVLYTLAAFYLAVHYTGQAWGTTATFAYIEGVSFKKFERQLLRNGLRVLAVWHIIWVSHQEHMLPNWILPLTYLAHGIVTGAALLCLLVGLVIFAKLWRRTRRVPPMTVFLPWLSIYLWYALIQVMPGAFYWLQISHALQYMIFPMRVEMNYYSRSHAPRGNEETRKTALLRHMILFYLVLIGIGYAAFAGVSTIFQSSPALVAAGTISVFINIHHYFIDGCIWKISNPTVRKALFVHLNT